MKCENCIHYECCTFMKDKPCLHYKDKSLVVELPCEIGQTVYRITTCEEFQYELDGTLYDGNGGYGTATGYYCPCELRDNCPFNDEENFDCDKQKNTLAVFEDEVKGVVIDECATVILLDYTGNVYISDLGKTVFLTEEQAKAKLEEMEN